jgi:hypothetical protein
MVRSSFKEVSNRGGFQKTVLRISYDRHPSRGALSKN